jgi:hypothetical protein
MTVVRQVLGGDANGTRRLLRRRLGGDADGAHFLKRRPKPCVKLITPDGTETSTSTLTRTCWGYQLNMTA